MSSDGYACDLHVDRRLRRILLGSGALAWPAGCLLLSAVPAPAVLAAALGCLWTASCWLELAALARGMARIDRIRITPAGHVFGIAPDGGRQALEVLPGSVVLGRAAWLRLRFADGRRTGEWLVPGSAGHRAWHGLQVAWHQCGGRFGRLPGS